MQTCEHVGCCVGVGHMGLKQQQQAELKRQSRSNSQQNQQQVEPSVSRTSSKVCHGVKQVILWGTKALSKLSTASHMGSNLLEILIGTRLLGVTMVTNLCSCFVITYLFTTNYDLVQVKQPFISVSLTQRDNSST